MRRAPRSIARRRGAALASATVIALSLGVPAIPRAGAAPEPAPSEGPIIGVQIAAGPDVIRPVSAAAGGILVEWPGGRRTLPGGEHRLELTERGALLGTIDFGHDIPFRFRAEARSVRLGDRYYEGWLEVLVPADGAPWRVVNRLPLERYLLGVVPAEMPAEFPLQALGAQAVAARTYALFQILARPADARIHVYDDDRSQVFRGSGGADEQRVIEAITRTRGQVLLHHGKLFESFYHSTCGGATRGVEDWFGGDPIEPLSSVPCGACSTSKYYRWDARIPEARLRAALEPICRRNRLAIGEILAIEPVEPAPGGHCAYVRVRHTGGSFEIDAERFRSACRGEDREFRSSAFLAERKGNEFVFSGRGWGHGVGLCQVGARGFAEKRAAYRWILAHYYPGSEIATLWR